MHAHRQPGETLVQSHGRPGQFVVYDDDNPVTPQPDGGQRYPFLLPFAHWTLRSRPLPRPDIAPDETFPSLRWVRADKVVDLLIPTGQTLPRDERLPGQVGAHMDGLPAADCLSALGLELDLRDGPAVLSKRLARLFSPYRYWDFFTADEIRILHDPALNRRLWDGCGLVSRPFLQRFRQRCLAHVPDRFQAGYARELGRAQRLEITLLHADGQEKGDVLVSDNLPDGADFLFPAGSSKRQVRLADGRTFVGFSQVRHARAPIQLDIQSLINHYPFFGADRLLAWLQADNQQFLAQLQDGRLDELLSRLLHVAEKADLDSLERWWLGSYFAGGGQALWFGGIVQALGRQRLNRLDHQLGGKQRFPLPGGRAYLFPAAVGGRAVPPGHLELNLAQATAYVNDADWLHTVVPILGGCDGDDAVWLFPFTDAGQDDIDPQTGEISHPRRLLVWRSPNLDGEYVLLRPTETSDDLGSWPELDSRQLSPRIDRADIHYGRLEPGPDALPLPPDADPPALRRRAFLQGLPAALPAALAQPITTYRVSWMNQALARAAQNRGALGMFVNILMVAKAVEGQVPAVQPARLEQVIDGLVKDGLDLTPVKAWCRSEATRLAQGYAIPTWLQPRLAGLTRVPLRAGQDHWFDRLMAGAQAELDACQAALDALARACRPPLELVEQGRRWADAAGEVLDAYRRRLGLPGGRPDYSGAAQAAQHVLDSWPVAVQPQLIAGLVNRLYAGGLEQPHADDILWQHGPTEPSLAQRTLAGLRALGLLGEPVWTRAGAVLYYHDAPPTPTAIPLTLNGCWFNWLRVTQPATPPAMGAVPKATAQWAKRQMAGLAGRFVGQTLTAATRDGRLVLLTARANLLGYVKQGQEGWLTCAQVRVAYCAATRDGNLQLLVTPV